MMGGPDRSHHVDPWPPKNGVVGRLDVEDTELCDDVERILVDWELDRAGGTSFAPVESIEE